MKIWIEKNTKWDGSERYYVMCDTDCLASGETLEDVQPKYDLAVKSYKEPMVEKFQEVTL